MDDAGRPAVEFLDGAPAPGPEEVLAGPPPRDSRNRVIVLLGALLVIGAGAAVARFAGESDPVPASPAAAASTPDRVMPVTPGSGQATAASEVPLPSRCETAGCVIVMGIPASAERAVHAVLPNAVLHEGYTVMSDDQRSLRSRNVRGVLGGEDLVLDVGAAPAVRQLRVSAQREGRMLRVVARVSHYRITITAAGPGVALADLRRLALDPALLEPR
jgi:hypothetical protein